MKLFKSLIIGSLAASSILVNANEPLWTPQQRQENRSHVAEVNIIDGKRLDWKSPSDDTFWSEASIQIKKAVKGEFGIMKIYYLTSDEAEKRCPKLPTLIKGQTYLVHCVEQLVEGKKRLVVPLASDVALTTPAKSNNLPAPK